MTVRSEPAYRTRAVSDVKSADRVFGLRSEVAALAMGCGGICENPEESLVSLII